jgi:hypothetical protein
VREETELRVQTAYNKLERTRQMMQLEEVLVLRTESHRVRQQPREEARFARVATAGAHVNWKPKHCSFSHSWNTSKLMTK